MAFSMPSMKVDGGTVEMLSWIVAYCVASSSMTILNKAAIKAFNFPFWLCTLQNLATLAVLGVIVAIAPKGHAIFGLRVKYSNKVVLTWTPAAILFCTMLVSRNVRHADNVCHHCARDAIAHATGNAHP